MTSRFEGKNLVQKLAIIQGEARYVQKNGYNAHHKYKYVREADLVEKIAPLLAEAGIMLVPNLTKHEREGTVTRLTIAYTITDGEETLTATVMGEGADAQDKGAYKAMTGAHKYLLYKLFNVETGDDPEAEDEPEPKKAPQLHNHSVVTQVAAALGGKAFDDDEMIYVRLNECQSDDDLKALGAKVKAQRGQDKKFMDAFLLQWKKRSSEIANGQ